MTSKTAEAAEEIERLRVKLYAIVNDYGLSSPEALQASQRLDTKLNEYNQLLLLSTKQGQKEKNGTAGSK